MRVGALPKRRHEERDGMEMRHSVSRVYLSWLFVALFFLAVFLLQFGLNMQRNLNHDEHQFVASGVLLAEEGLLPYRDYPYFHAPNLTLVYALLFRATEYNLLAARLFSVLCAFASTVLLFALAHWLFKGERRRVRLGIAAGAVLLLISNPLFIYTSGRAWNHDVPVLLSLLAFMAHSAALHSSKGSKLFFCSGLLIGLAAGTRLSFAPLVLPFAVTIFWSRGGASPSNRARLLVAFVLGLFLSALPSLFLFAEAPGRFLFGNLVYPQLNTQFAAAGNSAAVSIGGRLLYLARDVILGGPGNLLLVIAFALLVLVPLFTRLRARRSGSSQELFLLLLLPFLLVGSFAPAPPFLQYFYVLVPFAALTILFGLRNLRRASTGWALPVYGTIVLLSVITGIPGYQNLDRIMKPDEWLPVKVHRDGVAIARLAGANKVLTVAPAVPLEGGVDVYEAYATGPFVPRVAGLLSPEERAANGMVAAEEVPALLQQDAPRAVLVGLDKSDRDEEAALLRYAQDNEYVEVPMRRGTLWLSPLVDWGGSIRLAAVTLPQEPLTPGQSFPVMFYLQSIKEIEADLNVLVRLVAPDGSEVARDEGWPWGAPTSTWKLHDIWYDGHELAIPAGVAPGYYRVELGFYDPATLAHLPASGARSGTPRGDTVPVGYVTIGETVDFVQGQREVGAELGDSIVLLGGDLQGQQGESLAGGEFPVHAGGQVQVQLYWQVSKPPVTDYTTFVHVVAPDGQLLTQQDRQPLGGFLPMTLWQPERAIRDDLYELQLPVDALPGQYEVRVGLYDPATGLRLPVVQDDRQGDYVRLGTMWLQ